MVFLHLTFCQFCFLSPLCLERVPLTVCESAVSFTLPNYKYCSPLSGGELLTFGLQFKRKEHV